MPRKSKTVREREQQVRDLLDWSEPVEENDETVHWASHTRDGVVTHYRGETTDQVIAAAAAHLAATGVIEAEE